MATTILEKQQRRSAIHDELATFSKAAKLAGDRPFTADERSRIETLMNESNALKAEIETLEGDAAKRKLIDELGSELSQSNGRQTQPDTLGTVRHDDEGRVTSFMEATDEDVTINFTDDPTARRRQGYLSQKKADWRQLRKAGYQPCGKGGQFASFTDFCRQGLASHQTQGFQAKIAKHYEQLSLPTGMNESSGSEGGFMVMPEFAGGIIDRVYSNPLWSRTDNYSVVGNNITFNVNAETSRANGSRHGGLRGYWVDEAGTITSSKPTFRQVSLKLVKLGVLVYLTDELLSDGGAALEQYVQRKAAEEFEFMIGDSLINGTGVGQPVGILNAPSLVSVAKESGQSAATILPENIVKMNARFFAPNNGNSLFLKNQDVNPQLELMVLGTGTSGQVVYMPPGMLAASPYATLSGRPTLDTEFNATLGTQGDLIKADLGQILSISKGGIMSAASMHVSFITDQMCLRFIMRLNARPWESAPITPYKGTSNTQSNFVVIDTRS